MPTGSTAPVAAPVTPTASPFQVAPSSLPPLTGVNAPAPAPVQTPVQTSAIDSNDQATNINPNNTPATTQANQTESTNNTAATNLATSTNSNPTTPFISTSDSIEAQENNTAGIVNNINANNQATTDAHNNYISTLQAEQASLVAQGQSEAASINADFDSQENDLKNTQTGENAQEATLQQRSGGYLGQGASQTGALISLNQTHIAEQNKLEASRQAAIQAANDAIDTKSYAVAQSLAQEAKDYAAAMKQNQQDYLDNQIKIQQSQNDAITAAQSQADASLKALSSLTPEEVSKIDPAQLTKIDQAYGVQGFAANYIAATSAANAAKSQSDLVDAQQKILTLLQDIPAGQKVTFPDPTNPTGPGTTYTGMGKTGDISTFSETDDNGNVTVIAYNKGNGTITRTPIGAVGHASTANASATATGTRLGYMDQFISDPKNNILVPGDATNPNSPKYMTADNYVAMYQKYVNQYPGQGSEFLSQYPVQESVLPSQRKSTELSSFSQSDSTRAGSGATPSDTETGQ